MRACSGSMTVARQSAQSNHPGAWRLLWGMPDMMGGHLNVQTCVCATCTSQFTTRSQVYSTGFKKQTATGQGVAQQLACRERLRMDRRLSTHPCQQENRGEREAKPDAHHAKAGGVRIRTGYPSNLGYCRPTRASSQPRCSETKQKVAAAHRCRRARRKPSLLKFSKGQLYVMDTAAPRGQQPWIATPRTERAGGPAARRTRHTACGTTAGICCVQAHAHN
jgi:hypothetical protein